MANSIDQSITWLMIDVKVVLALTFGTAWGNLTREIIPRMKREDNLLKRDTEEECIEIGVIIASVIESEDIRQSSLRKRILGISVVVMEAVE